MIYLVAVYLLIGFLFILFFRGKSGKASIAEFLSLIIWWPLIAFILFIEFLEKIKI